VAVGGFSGSGKSTIAAALAADLGAAPGARIIASDRLRKRAFGQAATTRLPAEAYTPQVSERVYAEMATEAAAALAAGHSVIADAVFDRADTRARIRAVADDAGLPFDGLWLAAPEAVLVERVTARRGDPSDADADVVRAQLARAAGSAGPADWHHLTADGMPGDRAARARAMLGLASAPIPTSATAPE
jgi:predicted kinase